MRVSRTVRAVALALAVGALPLPAGAAAPTSPPVRAAQEEVQPPPAGRFNPGWTAATRYARSYPHLRQELVLIDRDGRARVISSSVGGGRQVVAISMDARWVLVTRDLHDGRRQYTVWDTHSRRHSTFTVRNAFYRARITTSGQVVLANEITTVVTVYGRTGRVLRTLPPTRDPHETRLFVTPDGERVVYTSAAGLEVRRVRGGATAAPIPLPAARITCTVTSLWDQDTATVACIPPGDDPWYEPMLKDVYLVPLHGGRPRLVLRTPWELRHTTPNLLLSGSDHSWMFVGRLVDGRLEEIRLHSPGLAELLGAHGSDVWVRRWPFEVLADDELPDPDEDNLLRIELDTGREVVVSQRVTTAVVLDGQN